jgi:tetratricopeptide (TPR) repeat protein
MRRPHRNLRRFPAAGLLLMALGQIECSSSARAILDRAEAAWRSSRYEEAVRANQELYKLDSRGKLAPQALLNIGDIYYLNLRQLKSAIEYYDKLTREFPAAPEALQARRQLAAIYMNEEIILDLDQAIAQYDKILEAGDLADRQEIRFQRAEAIFKNGDYSRALRELSSLEEEGVNDGLAARISLRIGTIYMIEKRYSEAVEPFRKILASNNVECRRRAILNLAECYENLYDFQNAVETLRKLDATPENEQLILKEIERLNKKRRDVERGGPALWPQPKKK